MSKNKELQPKIAINTQYVKDLSFESPDAPASLVPQKNQPKIDLSLNLQAKEVEKNNYEVVIEVVAKATSGDKTLFVLELAYAGLFTVENFNEEQKELILLIHCPTILFPFARRIIADATRDGGFQPLLVDPVDFNMLYQQRKQEKEKKK